MSACLGAVGPNYSITYVPGAVTVGPATTIPVANPTQSPFPTPAPPTTQPIATPQPIATITIAKIKLSHTTVTWCKRCSYPDTKLGFTPSAKADVRLKLLTKLHGRLEQVAVTTLHGHQGENSFRVAGRWHAELVPRRVLRVLIQINPGTSWTTIKTVTLTVRSPYTTKVIHH